MWQVLGSLIDFLHALSMVLWVVGLPLLFVRRWPRLTKAYGVYAISFVVLSQGSKLLIGECFMTTLARLSWERSSSPVDPSEWFTVRASKAVFGMIPPHSVITHLGELLIFITAIGALLSLYRHRAELAERRAK